MEKFSTKQRIKIIELYLENQRSIILTQRAYRWHYNVRQAPNQSTIDRLVERFGQQGSVSNLPRTGRQRSVRTAENIAFVEDSIAENPGTSTRRRATQIGMSRRSLQRILRELHLFPYKIQMLQALQPTDLQSRLAYAVHIQQLAREQNEFIHKLIEAHFHLNEFVNKQNCRIWQLKIQEPFISVNCIQ